MEHLPHSGSTRDKPEKSRPMIMMLIVVAILVVLAVLLLVGALVG